MNVIITVITYFISLLAQIKLDLRHFPRSFVEELILSFPYVGCRATQTNVPVIIAATIASFILVILL